MQWYFVSSYYNIMITYESIELSRPDMLTVYFVKLEKSYSTPTNSMILWWIFNHHLWTTIILCSCFCYSMRRYISHIVTYCICRFPLSRHIVGRSPCINSNTCKYSERCAIEVFNKLDYLKLQLKCVLT